MINLKKELEIRDMTREDLRAMTGLGKSTIANAVNGYAVWARTAQKICEALEIPFNTRDWPARISTRKTHPRQCDQDPVDRSFDRFKNGLKVGQNVKVLYNAQSTDSRKNKILKARLVGMFDTWGLVEIKLKSGLKIKKGFCYTDIKRCSK